MATLGHNTIHSYGEFTQTLMERFDRKDPKIHFRELAQLKQTGSVEAFISEFQRIAVMVTDVSESRLTMLFIEVLTEPLRGWVKAYKSPTLQDAISRARDLYRIQSQRTGFHSRPTFQLGTRTRNLSSMTYRRKHGETMTLGKT